jgi:hypothetical protein
MIRTSVTVGIFFRMSMASKERRFFERERVNFVERRTSIWIDDYSDDFDRRLKRRIFERKGESVDCVTTSVNHDTVASVDCV